MEEYRDQSLTQAAEKRIQRHLQRILESPEFYATQRQREFLQYVVTKTIAGRSAEIKGYTVATEVFGRKEDFDQATDPIVSIQANQLRRALERYYLIAGKGDPIRIDIPKGTYVPIFCEERGVETDVDESGKESDITSDGDSWPTLLIKPLQNLTGDPERDYFGIGLATELATEIARFQEIKVLLYEPEAQEASVPNSIIRFIVGGSIRRYKMGIRVTVNLTDSETRQQIWADTYDSDLEPFQLADFEEEVARLIAAKIVGERGIIIRTLFIDSKRRKPSELKTYEAILRYYQYDWTLDPVNFASALQALERAVHIEPECGQVWSMLARLYANAYSLDHPGFETALKKALAFAEEGARLTPDSQRARAILALVRMFANELPAARRDIEMALVLGPNSLFMLDGIGYLMTLLGEWEKGRALIEKVIKLNPFYNPLVHYAVWMDCLRQEDFEGSYAEAMSLRRPAVFWYPLAKAATLGLLGRDDEGKQFAENLLKLKPNFPSRGRVLIGHYIKFEEIVERVVEGLRRSGLKVKKD